MIVLNPDSPQYSIDAPSNLGDLPIALVVFLVVRCRGTVGFLGLHAKKPCQHGRKSECLSLASQLTESLGKFML